MATFKEAFTCKYQSNTNVEIKEVSFSPGDQVEVIKEWSGGTCLVKNTEGIVFNVPKDKIQ